MYVKEENNNFIYHLIETTILLTLKNVNNVAQIRKINPIVSHTNPRLSASFAIDRYICFRNDRILTNLKEILITLDKIHGMGILHKDIKFENIMLDKDNKIKIIDFDTSEYLGISPQRLVSLRTNTTKHIRPPYL